MANIGASSSPELVRLARLGWNATTTGPIVEGVRYIGDQIEVQYPDGGLAALGLDGGTGYWFDHRAQAVIDALMSASDARSIWDIGAGTGSMSRRLVQAAYDVVAVEPIPDGAQAIARQGVEAVFCSSLSQLGLPIALCASSGCLMWWNTSRTPPSCWRRSIAYCNRLVSPSSRCRPSPFFGVMKTK